MASADLLRLDLATFSDPGTLIESSQGEGGWYDVAWFEEGVRRQALVRIDGGDPVEVRLENGLSQSYSTFLAGDAMANLRQLARNTLNVVPELETFVAPTATVQEYDTTMEGDAVELLLENAYPGADQTSLVFVAADAGVGKSELLKRAVRVQADRYLKGEATSLWIYVDAQARRLAALDEALASELDRLRAKFSFDATTPLVRTGALTLVIDGFDELIGSVGAYGEAFNSLGDFIASLRGRGAVVAAARSSYYEQEFLSRSSVGIAEDRWFLKPFKLREWNTDERVSFVTAQARSAGRTVAEADELVRDVEAALAQGELAGVAGKPFFVDRTTRLAIAGDLEGDDDVPDLLGRLVRSYLERETRKLQSPAKEPLLSFNQFREFYEELAVEMWRQESRELTKTSVRELAVLLGETFGVDEDGSREIAARAPYFAMLREGSTNGGVGWEHDVFFAYFLSNPIAHAVSREDPLRLSQTLRRGRLPEYGALRAGSLTRALSVEGILTLFSAAVDLENVNPEEVKRNCGLLLAGRLTNGRHENLVLQDVIIGDISLAQVQFVNCTFVRTWLLGTDLTTTHFLGCSAQGSNRLQRVIVDPQDGGTRLQIENLAVSSFEGLMVRSDAVEVVQYSPEDMRVTLEKCGLPSAVPAATIRNVSADLLDGVTKVAWHFTRANVLVEGGDGNESVVSLSVWPQLKRALVNSGVVVPHKQGASGRKTFFQRRVSSAEIMRGLDPSADVLPSVRALWAELESA